MAYVRVARLDEIPAGRVKVVMVQRQDIALCRVRQDEVYAVSNVCTHDYGALDQGTASGYVIECPRHGARFDLRDGRPLTPPAVEGVRTYPVRIVDGAVEVDPTP